jgi:hypothetical protein
MAIEDDAGDEASRLDDGWRVLPCGHEVATSGRRPGCAPRALDQFSDRLLARPALGRPGTRGYPGNRRLRSAPVRAAGSGLTRAQHSCTGAASQAAGAAELRAAVSAAIAELHSVFSDYDHVTAAAYINEKLLVSPIGGGTMGARGL